MKANFYDFDHTLAVQDWSTLLKSQMAYLLSLDQSVIYSLENATPLRAVDRMYNQYNNGELVYVLTARIHDKLIQKGIQKFLNKYGITIPLNSILMVGGVGEAKSRVIRKIMPQITSMEFHDDLYENIEAVEMMAKEFPEVHTETFFIQR